MKKQIIAFASLMLLGMVQSCKEPPTFDARNMKLDYTDSALVIEPTRHDTKTKQVNPTQLTLEFKTDAKKALRKFENSLIVISGQVHKANFPDKPKNDCDNNIFFWSTDPPPRLEQPLKIKCCINHFNITNVYEPGSYVTIKCRLVSFSENIILLEEIEE